MSFRNSASFGKRIEYWIAGLLLKNGFDVFVPLVDDDGIDIMLRGKTKSIHIQIKARSKEVKFGDAALFAALQHPEIRNDYYFIFYSERLDIMWLLSSQEFCDECVTNKTGKNIGKKSIWFNGTSKKNNIEYGAEKFNKYIFYQNNQLIGIERLNLLLN